MRRALALIALTAAVRIVVAIHFPLVPDEAYYWDWSRHLAPAYFDHPGGIAFVIRAGTVLLGVTPLGVRLGSILAGIGATLVVVALARRWGGPAAAWRAALIACTMPLASAGLLLASPDAPMLLGAIVTIWAIDRALTSAGWRALAAWLVAGLALGAALECKLTAGLIPASVALACLMRADLRRCLRGPGPFVACAVALLVLLPAIRWNAAHDWISWRFQLHHGLGAVHGSMLARELAFIGGEAGLISPILFGLLIVAVARALRRSTPAPVFLAGTVSLAIFGFFAWSALRHPVEANWPAPAIVIAIPLLAALALTPALRRWQAGGIALAAALSVLIYVHAIRPILPIDPRQDPVAQAYGWDAVAQSVAGVPAQWVAANRYQDAAELAFHLPTHPPVFSLNVGSRPNQYDLWPTLVERAAPGDTVVLVADEGDPPPEVVTMFRRAGATVVAGPLVMLRWHGSVVGRRRLWQISGLTHIP